MHAIGQEGIPFDLDLILLLNLVCFLKQTHLSDKDGVKDGCKVLTELQTAPWAERIYALRQSLQQNQSDICY